MAYADETTSYEDPGELYISSLDNARSKETMTQGLQRFSSYLNNGHSKSILDIAWARITYQDILKFKDHLIKAQLKPNTISSYLAAVRGALRKAATISSVDPDKRVSHSVLIEITEQVKAPATKGKKQLNYVAKRDFDAIMESCDDSPAGHRDKAIILLMYACGLRRSEVVSLKTPDSLNWVQQHIVIEGKGNKRREIPMFDELAQALINWFELARGEEPGYIFFPLSKSGRPLKDKELTPFGIGHIVKKRCAMAHTETYRPHDFRGTFATTLFELDTDLFTVMELMGHDDPSTTKRYDLRNSEAGYDAIKRLGKHINRT